jgi:hypothetical protein
VKWAVEHDTPSPGHGGRVLLDSLQHCTLAQAKSTTRLTVDAPLLLLLLLLFLDLTLGS